MDHFSFETLIEYTENRLSAAKRAAIAAHLETCAICRGELERVRRIFNDIAVEPWVAPADHLVSRVMSAFHRQANRLPQRSLKPVHLNVDSWAQLAALGIRGSSRERQFLFSENGFDLDVQVVREPSAQDYALQGQLLSNDDENADMQGIEVRLGHANSERRGLTDYLGRFNFVGLAAGTYTLKLILNDRDLLIETLPIEAMPTES